MNTFVTVGKQPCANIQCLEDRNMEHFFDAINNSPLFVFLFGSGGIIIVVLAIMQFSKKEKTNPPNPDINVSINFSDDPPNNETSGETKFNLDIKKPEPTNKDSYKNYDFSSDDFYISFLAEVEKKTRGKDKIDYE